MVNYVSTKLRVYFKKRSAKDLFGDVYAIFFLIFFIKANVVGTYLNCINKLMQFKCVPTTYTLRTLQPFYNTVHYNTVLDITRFKDGSQKCKDYIEK